MISYSLHTFQSFFELDNSKLAASDKSTFNLFIYLKRLESKVLNLIYDLALKLDLKVKIMKTTMTTAIQIQKVNITTVIIMNMNLQMIPN